MGDVLILQSNFVVGDVNQRNYPATDDVSGHTGFVVTSVSLMISPVIKIAIPTAGIVKANANGYKLPAMANVQETTSIAMNTVMIPMTKMLYGTVVMVNALRKADHAMVNVSETEHYVALMKLQYALKMKAGMSTENVMEVVSISGLPAMVNV